jgi:hypothetical protein
MNLPGESSGEKGKNDENEQEQGVPDLDSPFPKHDSASIS